MIRALLVLAAAAAVLVTASAVIGQPGRATLEWLGWRIDMTAAAALMLLVIGALAATAFWRTVIWVAQAPDWSDLDPEGKAFAYTPQDWARLVATYAETGELVHPRLERRERTIAELPQLPPGYQASAPFLRAAEAGSALAPLPDDPGPPETVPAPPPEAVPPAKGRRLGARLRRR